MTNYKMELLPQGRDINSLLSIHLKGIEPDQDYTVDEVVHILMTSIDHSEIAFYFQLLLLHNIFLYSYLDFVIRCIDHAMDIPNIMIATKALEYLQHFPFDLEITLPNDGSLVLLGN